MKNNFISSLVSKIKNFKHLKTLIVVVLSVIVLVIFASSFVSKKSNKTQESTNVSSNALSYCKQQEHRLEQVLENVKGISNVNVFVMVDESPTLKYVEDNSQTQSQNQTTSTSETVLTKNGSVTSPIVVCEILPKIKGVLVIAKGAGDLKIKTTLTNIISSVLGINISSVEVLEGK